MPQTKKRQPSYRAGPSGSATLFDEGTTKKGNDGNMWTIIVTDKGVHRWSRSTTSPKNMTARNRNKTKNSNSKQVSISHETLVQMTKKYQVTSSGSKKQLADRLWRISGTTIPAKYLAKIVHLLSKDAQKKVNKKITDQLAKPVTNYRGMWYPQPKPLRQMARAELLERVRNFRDAWEKITTRNQDLNDDRLSEETDTQLRTHLKFYFHKGARIQSEEWLRET
jgi:hypothetical protein